jgi:integrase/recombinase XerC
VAATSWTVNETMILTRSEVAAVLEDLRRKAKRSVNTRQNLVIFRLATCCGLRVSELIGLNLADVRVGIARPHIRVRKAVAKLGKQRQVPLWWDGGTLADLRAWKDERASQGAGPHDPFVCSQAAGNRGRRLDRRNARQRFKAACAVLGDERRALLTIHHGRHTFVSHALAAGRSLAEVQQAAGHASVATTSIYTHVAVEDDGTIGNIFG